jgi:transketolase
MRKTCLNTVYELAKRDERIFFIGSDLGFGTLDEFKREMPERFFMEGVAEANVVGMAAGLALCGNICYVNTIATFLTRRAYEQVALDLCLHNALVRLIGNGGGVVYAPLGPTHLAIEDLALMRALPNMTILAPADAAEMRRLMPATVDHPGPIYIRLAKGGDRIVTADWPEYGIGQAVEARPGGDALVVTTGITLQIALRAAEQLAAQGLELCVLHMPTVKPLDHAALLAKLAELPVIVTMEEHVINGGLGSAVAEVLLEADFPERKLFRRLALPDAFPDHYGSQDQLLEHHGLTADNLCATVRAMIQARGGRRLAPAAAVAG